MKSEIEAVALALRDVADATRQAPMAAYMRDQFVFLGVPAPQRRAATNAVFAGRKAWQKDELIDLAQVLWDRPEREYQYCAIDLLTMHAAKLNARHLPYLIGLAQSKSWWDTVDAIASLIGKVLRHGHEGMDEAIGHENMWARRVALLHQLGWGDQTDRNRLFSYALIRAHEKEFFIQKAIGWALRDYARTRRRRYGNLPRRKYADFLR